MLHGDALVGGAHGPARTEGRLALLAVDPERGAGHHPARRQCDLQTRLAVHGLGVAKLDCPFEIGDGVIAAAVLGDNPRDVELVRRGEHPDVREIERVGASISVDQADEVIRLAAMAPVEGRRKVLILDEFHLLRPEGAAKLLKGPRM